MIYQIYPKKDATIYERLDDLNTGLDSLLEVHKTLVGIENEDNTVTTKSYASRVLMQFDYTDLDTLIAAGFDIANANNKYALKLYATQEQQLPADFTLEVNTVSGSWNMGLGRYDYAPGLTDGVSWIYRSSKTDGSTWPTSSFVDGTTGSWTIIPGGGSWYTGSSLIVTKSYQFNELNDPEIDITNIIYSHINNVTPNNGILIRRTTEEEASIADEMKLSFFSSDTNTIYLPHLIVKWDNSEFDTGSLSAMPQADNIIFFKNLKHTYTTNERIKLRLAGRAKYPVKTFSTSSVYSTSYYLPASSSYSIEDLHTKEVVIPHDYIYTKISCDPTGSYFNFWVDSLQPERWYKFSIKCKFDTDDIRIYNTDYIFKVERPS